jgi:hypothetical protein
MATVDCVTEVGFASAAAPAAWSGREASRRIADWLPRIEEPFLDARTGLISKRWYNYLRELGDRVGGVQGPSIGQVQQTVIATQNQLAVTTQYATKVGDFAQGIAATAEATAQVAQNNSLSGSGSIPDTGDPPPRPGTYAR